MKQVSFRYNLTGLDTGAASVFAAGQPVLPDPFRHRATSRLHPNSESAAMAIAEDPLTQRSSAAYCCMNDEATSGRFDAMRLSRKSEYACLAMIDLAQHYRVKPVNMTDLAKRKGIPKKYLEQILLALKRAGHVKSTRGPGGGYQLAKPPRRISLAEIIRLLDGPLAPVESVSKYFYEHTPVEANKKLIRVFKDIRDYAAKKLEHAYLSDFL